MKGGSRYDYTAEAHPILSSILSLYANYTPLPSISQPPLSHALYASYFRIPKKRRNQQQLDTEALHTAKRPALSLNETLKQQVYSEAIDREAGVYGLESDGQRTKEATTQRRSLLYNAPSVTLSYTQLASLLAVPEERLTALGTGLLQPSKQDASNLKQVGIRTIFEKSHQTVYSKDLTLLELAYICQYATALLAADSESEAIEKKLEHNSCIVHQQVSSHVPLEAIKCLYDDLPFQCQICGLRMKSSAAKSSHLTRHYEEQQRLQAQAASFKTVSKNIRNAAKSLQLMSRTAWEGLSQWINGSPFHSHKASTKAHLVSAVRLTSGAALDTLASKLLKPFTVLSVDVTSSEQTLQLPPWFPVKLPEGQKFLAAYQKEHTSSQSAIEVSTVPQDSLDHPAMEHSALPATFATKQLETMWNWALAEELNEPSLPPVQPHSTQRKVIGTCERYVSHLTSGIPADVSRFASLTEDAQFLEAIDDLLCCVKYKNTEAFGSADARFGVSFIRKLFERVLCLSRYLTLLPEYRYSINTVSKDKLDDAGTVIDEGYMMSNALFDVKHDKLEDTRERDCIHVLSTSSLMNRFASCNQCLGRFRIVWNTAFSDWFYLNAVSVLKKEDAGDSVELKALLKEWGGVRQSASNTQVVTQPIDSFTVTDKKPHVVEKSLELGDSENAHNSVSELSQSNLMKWNEASNLASRQNAATTLDICLKSVQNKYDSEFIVLEPLDYGKRDSVDEKAKSRRPLNTVNDLWGSMPDVFWNLESFEADRDDSYTTNHPWLSGGNLLAYSDMRALDHNVKEWDSDIASPLFYLYPNFHTQLNCLEIDDPSSENDIRIDFEHSYCSFLVTEDEERDSRANESIVNRNSMLTLQQPESKRKSVSVQPLLGKIGLYPSYLHDGGSEVLTQIKTVHAGCLLNGSNVKQKQSNEDGEGPTDECLLASIDMIVTMLNSETESTLNHQYETASLYTERPAESFPDASVEKQNAPSYTNGSAPQAVSNSVGSHVQKLLQNQHAPKISYKNKRSSEGLYFTKEVPGASAVHCRF